MAEIPPLLIIDPPPEDPLPLPPPPLPSNLLWTNDNPNPDTICPMCTPFIGKVFEPGNELPLPAHPGCYCTYWPTRARTTPTDWDQFWNAANPDTRLGWLRHTAYLLRKYAGLELYLIIWLIPSSLRPLIPAAREYNEQREKSTQESPMIDSVPQKNIPARATTGRVLLQPTATSTRGGRAAANISGRREYDCIFMRPGRVKQADQEPSNWLIPADVIRAAQPHFNSVSSYLDHPEMFGFGWHQNPQVHNLAGVTFDARWSDAENAMAGCIRLYDQKPDSAGALVGALMDQMLADQAAGLEVPKVGLSAVIFQEDFLDEEAGLRITSNISYVESIDFVYDAGAHGYVRAALAAVQPHRRIWQAATIIGGTEMPEQESTNQPAVPDVVPPASLPVSEPIPLTEALAAINRVSERVEALATQVEGLSPSPPADDVAAPDPVTAQIEALTTQVERLANVTAAREETTTVEGMGQPPRLFGGHTGLDQVRIALQAMVDGVRPADGVRPLTGIRELYHLLSGDFEMNGLFNRDHVHLANVNCSTMAGLVANALNKRVVNIFQEYPQWWAPLVTPEDFANLQQVKWITLGGIGELPTVAEGASYTQLTWDDQTETADFVKKGGYLGITLEAIDKDDTSKLRAAPRALAQAAWLTLSKSISAIFTANSGVGPDMSDSVALFNAAHSNLGTTALSHAAYVATRIAMRKQTELNSSERLGALIAPKYLLVPSDLEISGLQALATEQVPGSGDWNENPFASGNAHEARMAAARKRVIVIDLWTDTNNWAAVADPNLYPSIGLGFRYGRTPEIFSVASPTAGLMFTNDTMPVKVRFFFATGPTDWRGLYKHNVS